MAESKTLNTVKTTSIIRATVNGIVLGLVKDNVAKAVFFPRAGGWSEPSKEAMQDERIEPNVTRHGYNWDITEAQAKGIAFHIEQGWTIMREVEKIPDERNKVKE